MAVTYPLQMPTKGFSVARFRLTPVSTKNRLRSGATFGTTIAPAYWQASITTWPLYRLDQGKWVAFFDSLKGNVKPCLLYNPGRKIPAFYKTLTGLVKAGTSTPFTGTAALSSITSFAIGLNGLPANFVLSRGDLVGLVKGERYSLHRIVEDITANASGTTAAFQVEPPIAPLFDITSVVNLSSPLGEFILDTDSIDGDEETAEPHPISFSAKSRAI